jgi:hypothetical protein
VRRAGRTDGNQTPVRERLRELGCRVTVTSDVGKGFPDLVVRTRRGSLFLVEVKDGDEPLTIPELLFQAEWGESYVVVRTDDDARALAAR